MRLNQKRVFLMLISEETRVIHWQEKIFSKVCCEDENDNKNE